MPRAAACWLLKKRVGQEKYFPLTSDEKSFNKVLAFEC
jgi:hypothetical protein